MHFVVVVELCQCIYTYADRRQANVYSYIKI